ncbi:MAG: hypothetical protein HQK67_06615 [Desulfamplus sp.]|nr:hypothetical protein [Desulfamplus sp.]
MKKLSRDYNNTQRNYLGMKARLANEVAQGKYPDLTKDLLYMKACQDGLGVLPHDPSLMNKSISKIDALKILISLPKDTWELFIIFGMIDSIYAEVLS